MYMNTEGGNKVKLLYLNILTIDLKEHYNILGRSIKSVTHTYIHMYLATHKPSHTHR